MDLLELPETSSGTKQRIPTLRLISISVKMTNNGVEYQPIPLFKFHQDELWLMILDEIKINRYDVYPIYRSFIHMSKVGKTRFILISLGNGKLLQIQMMGLKIQWRTFR